MIKVTISIDVTDIAQAEKFYVEALGCKKKTEQAGMVILSTDNCDIYLQEKEAGTNAVELSKSISERSYDRHWTPIHLDFITTDIENITKKIVELGGTCEGGESWDGGSIRYCVDPFGNGFCVINE